MNEQVLFRIMRMLAENCFDGHFTVMRFTTAWSVSFGPQPDGRDDIAKMGSGPTLLDAFVKALELADWDRNTNRPVKPV